MAQSGFTPIKIYSSTTPAAVPTAGNLEQGELAINTNDGKLFYEDSSGVVQVLATKDSAAGSFGNLAYTGTLTGGTGVINIGSGQIYKDAAGLVGIGIASPTSNLHIRNTGGNATLKLEFGTGGTQSSIIGASGEMSFQVAGASAITSYTNSLERMRITSAGNVGIGTISPATKLDVLGTTQITTSSGSVAASIYGDSPSLAGGQGIVQIGSKDAAAADKGGVLTFTANTTSLNNYAMAAIAGKYQTAGAGVYGGYLQFITTSVGGAPTEAMRINANGRLIVGATNTFGSGASYINGIADGVTAYGLNIKNISATNTVFAVFSNSGEVQAGAIAQTGSLSVAYSTASDYRLKENVAPMTGALEKIAALKPCTYTWKADGSAGQGFIAHELQDVVPDCVTGEKDAVNKDGKPQYQGVDSSFLVATLVAAIQELKAEIDLLKGN
jgi:hypothetical protein